MQLEGIDHIAMGVRDIGQSAKWYIDVLGFERLHKGMWNGVPTFIGKGSTGIALFPASHEAKHSTHREIRMLHLAFRVDRENFLAAQRELEKRGIKFEFQDHQIAHSIYFCDPDGHELRDYHLRSGIAQRFQCVSFQAKSRNLWLIFRRCGARSSRDVSTSPGMTIDRRLEKQSAHSATFDAVRSLCHATAAILEFFSAAAGARFVAADFWQ